MRKNRKALDLFQLIDRRSFNKLVRKWEVDKWVRGLSTAKMTHTLIGAMTLRIGSYREIEQAFGVPRATFGDAMVRRHSGFFGELCDEVLLQIRARVRDRKVKKAIRQILAIDSSEIKVHGSLFSKAGWKQLTSHGHLASAKLHVVWNVTGGWVDDHLITGGRSNDSPIARRLSLKPGSTYVFDRAYSDVNFWIDICKGGSDFVTRLKGLSIRRMKEARKAERKNRDGVLYDGIYRPSRTNTYSIKKKRDRRDVRWRHIVYRDPLTKKLFHFVTSHWRLGAQTVADIYKDRWSVELLFRWLKGHLDIRYLASKSKNAVNIQLAVAVLVQLQLQLKKIVEKYQGTLWELLRSLRTDLVRKAIAASRSRGHPPWKTRSDRSLNEASD